MNSEETEQADATSKASEASSVSEGDSSVSEGDSGGGDPESRDGGDKVPAHESRVDSEETSGKTNAALSLPTPADQSR